MEKGVRGSLAWAEPPDAAPGDRYEFQVEHVDLKQQELGGVMFQVTLTK